MTSIHRFPLPSAGLCKINMPEGAVILKLAATSAGISIWAMVDTTKEKKARYFQTFPTGAELPAWAWDAVYHDVPGLPAIHILEVEAGHLKPQDKA